MRPSVEAIVEDEIEFKWGPKSKNFRPDEDLHFYESFCFEGVEYFLYDCAYFYRTGDAETHIGKLVELFETSTHEKKVKVVWFLRPFEIRNFLGDIEPRWNEIFLASGEGVSVSNYNVLEAIVGKCNVVCTSKDRRNLRASEEELRMADYIFFRTFDIRKLTVHENFPDEIDHIKVECFFNIRRDQKLNNTPSNLQKNLKEEYAGKSSLPSNLGQAKVVGTAVTGGKSVQKLNPQEKEKSIARLHERGTFLNENPGVQSKANVERKGSLSGQISCSQDKSRVRSSHDLSLPTTSDRPCKRRIVLLDSKGLVIQNGKTTKAENFRMQASKISERSAPKPKQNNGVNTNSQVVEVTRRPDVDRKKWFKQPPWEERLQRAQEVGCLVLLKNLDPTFSSFEVEDLVWNAFNEKVVAKMIQRSTFSNPLYGTAFVIFKTKTAAETSLSELTKRCLILSNGRPVIGCRGVLRRPREVANFVGHLTIYRRQQRQSEEMRNAVSTSHGAQTNTIEYDMALQWCELQAKSDLWWKSLHETQKKEIILLRRQLKQKWQL